MKTILLFGLAASACFGQPGIISTVAGSVEGFAGDGGAATAAKLSLPSAVVVDRAGNLYIADQSNNRIRKVAPDGTISTFAGTGAFGSSGDGGPAAKATFFFPHDLAIDSAGNIYIADQGNDEVRKVNTSGIVSTAAGGILGRLSSADSVALDAAGNIYTSGAAGITKVDTSGNQTSVIANVIGFSGDGGPAKTAAVKQPSGIVIDSAGNLYFADTGNNRIRKVDKNGIINTIAGTGISGFSGDGGPAVSAQIHLAGAPFAGLSLDTAGNVYFADWGNNRIRMINTAGMITTVAGGGGIQLDKNNLWGDGKPATQANLSLPRGVFVDSNTNIYIADAGHSEIRKVTAGSAGTGGQTAGPTVSSAGVVNGASFQPGFAPGSWVTILGTNLAPLTDDWSNSIVDGKLPTSLDGVSVKVGGRDAYVYFISPSQINVLAPEVSPGTAPVTVTTPAGTSAAVNATANTYQPAFFTWPGNQAVATRTDYTFAVKAGTFAGATTTAAKPGDILVLWGTGFGPTTPAAPTGLAVPGDQAYATATLPTITINGVAATVLGAALSPGSAGLYQVAIQVPDSLANGDWTIQAGIGGTTSPTGAILSVQK